MDKIIRITVETEDGVVREFRGEGFVQEVSAQEKQDFGAAKIVGTQVTAHIVVPVEEV